MGPWDDLEVDSDGEELLDWLWDLPDRYDVGVDDDPEPRAVGAASGLGAAGVTKHLRAAGEAPPTAFDDRVTEAIESLAPVADADDGYEYDYAAFSQGLTVRPRPGRFTARELAAVAAVLVVIVAGIGLGYSLFNTGAGKGSKPSNLAIGPPTTPVTSFNPSPGPLVELPTTADTTATSDSTTTTLLPAASVPGVVGVATTSTTVHRCAVHMAAVLPMAEILPMAELSDSTSSTSSTTSTTSTTMPTSTTTSTSTSTSTTTDVTTTTTQAPTTTVAPTTQPTAPPTTACR
jgi:hypothetical protein